MMIRILFAGEGSDELGAWGNHAAYRPSWGEPGERGVLHALVRRFAEHETVGAERWKSVRKFRAGDHAKPEERTIMGLALLADEHECDALVFVRDRDRDEDRERDIERGIARASETFGVKIVGGTANEELEAWILAMLGTPQSETFGDAKSKLRELHHVESREQMCEVVDQADFEALRADGVSLRRWLERAKGALVARG